MGVNDKESVEKQYQNSNNLNARISIHDKYSTNKQGFGNWIFDHYEIQDSMSVLELGCGTGSMWTGTDALVNKCSRLILSDFSDGMLAQTKETLREMEGIEYRVIDIQDIPYEDNTFDIVIANMMLYHVPDLQKGLQEVRRVLKADGTFYCATFGENGIMEYIYSLFEAYGVKTSMNYAFTLQNGTEKLSKVFADVQRDDYKDSLEVTDVDDMVDYVYSLTNMSALQNLPRTKILDVLESNMVNGILRVPKDYGMFIVKGSRL